MPDPNRQPGQIPDTEPGCAAPGDVDAVLNELTEDAEAPGPPQSTTALPRVGDRVGDYTILEEIARGGMGVVYRARQTSLERTVAIKMILDCGSGTERQRQRFQNEAKSAASLDHAGIVPVYDVGIHRGFPFFSMAYIQGDSLADLLVAGPLAPRRAAEVARDVACAITYAHQKLIIHRDIKPANVLIDGDGQAKLTDFGVSKSLRDHSDLTTQGELVGTPHYMPPEQAGSDEATTASDVYSIGAMLFAMLTGRPPFQAASPIDVVTQVLQQSPVAPSALNAAVPAELETITLKCLNKRPQDRFASAQELADDLDRFLAGEPILARPPGLLRRTGYFIRRHFLVASVSGSAALMLVMLTGVVVLLLSRSRAEAERLSSSLQLTEQQLLSSRASLSQLVSQIEQRSELDSDGFRRLAAEIDVLRLSEVAQEIARDHPEWALQLDLEAIERALQRDIDPPQAAVDRVAKAAQTQTGEVAAEMPLRRQMRLANRSIQHPLTAEQRHLFGLSVLQRNDSAGQPVIQQAESTATGETN